MSQKSDVQDCAEILMQTAYSSDLNQRVQLMIWDQRENPTRKSTYKLAEDIIREVVQTVGVDRRRAPRQ